MFCPHCGVESSPGLRYCKHCGGNLSQATETLPPPAKFPMALTITFLVLIAFISMVGLMGPLIMASDMSMRGRPPGEFLPVMILGPLVALSIDALLVWLLLRLVKIYHHSGTTPQAQPRAATAIEFPPPQLNAPPASVGSVTEHTTRNFDEYEKKI